MSLLAMNPRRTHPHPTSDRERPALRRVVCGLLASLFLLAPARGTADATALVMVQGHAVADFQVEEALDSCRKHAPQLAPQECLDQFWIPRWLLDAAARERGVHEEAALQHTIADLLSQHVMNAVAETIDAPSESDIDAYLKKHARDFEKPLRIRIFRILVDTEEQAKSLLEKLTPTTKIQEFRDLARKHSVDRATNERGGDLGFVWPDGSTDVPQVSADAGLYRAALELDDGEFSKEPAIEGERFAVLWRRGSLPSVEIDDDARTVARLRIQEQRTMEATNELLRDLEKKHVSGRTDEPLAKLRRDGVALFQQP